MLKTEWGRENDIGRDTSRDPLSRSLLSAAGIRKESADAGFEVQGLTLNHFSS